MCLAIELHPNPAPLLLLFGVSESGFLSLVLVSNESEASLVSTDSVLGLPGLHRESLF